MPIDVLTALFAALFGYGLGSIPFGLLLTRLAGTVDIRAIGSKSIGATNVLRTGRKDLALATVLLDALKGSVAVWVAMRWGMPAGIVAGVAAFLGHCYPLWLKFAGGKGVATYIGVVLALWWPGIGVFALLWLGVAFLSRYSSLASLTASLGTTLALLAAQGLPSLRAYAPGIEGLGAALAVMTALLYWKHRPNIERLVSGSESKIGQKG